MNRTGLGPLLRACRNPPAIRRGGPRELPATIPPVNDSVDHVSDGARLPWLAGLLALLAGALGIAWWIDWCWPLVVDDAFISLRYSERFLAGEGLTWNPGDNVEGYSNFLWVLATSLLAALGLDWVEALRVLGVACSMGAVFGVWWAASAIAGPWFAIAAAAVLGAMAPVGIWAIAGLETPMVACWWALAAGCQLHGLKRWNMRLLWAGSGFLGLLVLTRPDGPLVVAAATLASLCGGWSRGSGHGVGAQDSSTQASGGRGSGRLFGALRPAVATAALPFAVFVAHTLFRLGYHGAPVPNTARIKGHLTAYTLDAGWSWLMAATNAWLPTVAVGFVGVLLLLLRRGSRPLGVWLGGTALIYSAYLVVVGGDVFPAYRLVAPALVPLAIATAAMVAVIPGGKPWSGMGRAVFVVILGSLMILGSWQRSSSDPKTRVALEERFQYDALALGQALRTAHPDGQPILAIDAAGALPFAYGGRCLDMIGLNDREIAGTEPLPYYPPEKKYIPGHLSGDGDIVMERRPDLMVWGPLPGSRFPIFRSSVEFEGDPRFQNNYRCVHYRVPPVEGAPINTAFPREEGEIQGHLWVRLDGLAGVTRDTVDGQSRVRVPAYLFASLRMPRVFDPYNEPAKGTPERAAWQRDIDQTEEWFALGPIRAVPAPGAADGEGLWGAVVPPSQARRKLAASTGTPLMDFAGFPIPFDDLALAPGDWTVEVEPQDAQRYFRATLHRAPANPNAWPPRPGAPLPAVEGVGYRITADGVALDGDRRVPCQLVLQRTDRETLDEPRMLHRIVLRRVDG